MTKIKTTSRYLLTLGIIVLSVVSVVVTQRAQAFSAIDNTQQIADASKNTSSSERPVYLDPNQPFEARVEDLLSRMTFEEKMLMVHADSKFTSAAIPRLGIPRRWLSDGPHGVREDVGPDNWQPAGRTDDFSSFMPALIGLAASWNP